MAHNEASAAWHPALRSEDGVPSNAPVSDDLTQDLKDSRTESSAELKPSQAVIQENALHISSASPDTDASDDVQPTAVPAATDSNAPPHAEQVLNQENTAENDASQEDAPDHDQALPQTMSNEPHIIETSEENAPTLEPAFGSDANGFPDTAVPVNMMDESSLAEHTERHEDNEAASWFNEHVDRGDHQTTNEFANDDNQDFWGSPTNGDAGDDFFSQLKTQTKPIYIPPETESRYEEGVPLLDNTAESPVQPSVKAESQIDKIFEDDGDDEGGAFFNEVQGSVPEAEADPSPIITRKSTTQVIGSLDAFPDSPVSTASPTVQEFDNILAATASEHQPKEDLSDDDLAAKWQAELSDEQPDKSSEDDLAARWQAALDDDDDLLLEDEIGEGSNNGQESLPQNLNRSVHEATQATLSSPFGTPQSSARPQAQPTSYTPHQPSTSDLLQGIPGIAPQSSAAPMQDYFAPPPQPRPTAKRAESFAERSKEGYKSPYDLPDDLTRPRKPVVTHKPVVAQPSSMPPPPRSSSIPGPPPNASGVPTPPAASTVPAVTTPKNFYEELPLPPPRPRSRPASSGRYTPTANIVTSPPSHSQPPPPPANPYASLSPPQDSGSVGSQPQLQQPERLDPYANLLGSSASGAPAAPSAASRYSPKPPTVQPGTTPPSAPRYSPAPPQSAAPAPPRTRYASQPSSVSSQGAVLPFQPRTSSPLAHHEKVSYQPPEGLAIRSAPDPASSYAPNGMQPRPNEQEVSDTITASVGAAGSAAVTAVPENVSAALQPTSPPRNPYAPPAYINEFSKRVAPMASPPPAVVPPPGDAQFIPPRRSQTQSPSQQASAPGLSVPSDPLQRPASVHAPASPTKSANPYAPSQISIHNRVPSQPLEFIPPNDGQELDPLERWKGAPIVKFGFGGSITSCFPKHVPRYAAGQAAPKIKSTPGEVKIVSANDWVPITEGIVQHPGPLKNKSKKKDLVAWLSSKIAAFENEGISEAAQLHPESSKRHDEKILLWKIVRALVEHDGVLEGSAEVEKSLRYIIFPHLQNSELEPTSGVNLPAFNALPPLNTPSQSDATDIQSIESIRNSLLVGNREKAVWDAVDSRLWGHAMIIASTLDRSVWKQVVQEFVRREVKSTTGNSESLAALYEIFAGNVDESIDELVPPSARAGLQMVSKVGGQGPSKNALEGLDSWKDTLGLVLSNRSPEDHKALLALGRLLLSYGRTEAAHICFMLSRAAVFGGADDPQTSIVLLGADHQHLPLNVLQDDDAILLTEAYEYAVSVLAGSPTSTLPHLLAFKLIHACSLAEHGRKSEALQYADAITAALKATTKPSGYHNQHLLFGIDELSARLRQTTSDSGSSWISRPSMEKVSGSMWAKFNSFVAGEDSDAASTGSGKAGDGDIGPFAKFSGTPTVSRSPSVSDFGPYSLPAAQSVPGSGPSRYQPVNQYVPNSSPEQYRGRSSLDSQRSASFGFPFGQRRGSQEPSTPVESSVYQGGPLYGSPSAAGYQSTPPQASYMPLAPVVEDSASQPYPVEHVPMQGSPVNISPYQPPANESFGEPLDQSSATAPASDVAGYVPPSVGGGYEPPSVEISAAPALDTTEQPTHQDALKKKKSFMDDDDDDDLAARAAAIQKAEKARKDREADEAFRKAAEADAKRPPAAKKSWFGGWFGGAKKENDNNSNNNSGGPIRAKLGEENSFYYDKELKKWVNKKDPNSASVSRGTPPPPKASAPPSRSASGSTALPAASMALGHDSRPPSSAGAPPSLSSSPAPSSLAAPPPMLGTARSASTSAAMTTPPMGSSLPPPRPATSLSNASSIDDLLGAPQARKGAPAKGRKKGRYVDVMAK
ncbi:Sec23-binding domain of Sec16-domain-containing protein [Aspergillus caelatus]|uniref:Protein transport protein sec16 n=1 Tax=Aspergillus caelatus TaxID=61420 RepID=A0A5N7AK68_9EURO|nr:Sec23-binding domain of Sec16-domain-containing protein [Aspergillus caelatus]KAE8369100.1 Sec23-binding domain of Sec16-domain-containing protein [Aspergillus caelatus]